MSKGDKILSAFQHGYSVGERDGHPRQNPFAPHTQSEKWEAWMCGYQREQGPKYVVRKPSLTPASPKNT